MHFARLANTLLKDEESERDNHVFAGNFAQNSPITKGALSKEHTGTSQGMLGGRKTDTGTEMCNER